MHLNITNIIPKYEIDEFAISIDWLIGSLSSSFHWPIVWKFLNEIFYYYKRKKLTICLWRRFAFNRSSSGRNRATIFKMDEFFTLFDVESIPFIEYQWDFEIECECRFKFLTDLQNQRLISLIRCNFCCCCCVEFNFFFTHGIKLSKGSKKRIAQRKSFHYLYDFIL